MSTLPKPHPDATTRLFDDGAVVLSPTREELVGLNNSAAFLWCCLEDGLTSEPMVEAYAEAYRIPPDLAVEQIAQVLRSFADKGLLDGPLQPSQPCRASVRQASVGPFSRGKYEAIYCILGELIAVFFPSAALRAAANEVLGHFQHSIAANDIGVEIDVISHGENMQIVVDGKSACLSPPNVDVVPDIKGAIIAAAINRTKFFADFHAAALERQKSVLLMPAASGSGKTCLSLALARSGFAWLSDETALLDSEQFWVRTVPQAPCIKKPAWPLIENLFPLFARSRAFQRCDGQIVKYLSIPRPDAMLPEDKPRPVRWIVFPKYRPGYKTSLKPISRRDALERLFSDCTAWRMPLEPVFMDRLLEWISGVNCSELEFSTFGTAVSKVTEFCAN